MGLCMSSETTYFIQIFAAFVFFLAASASLIAAGVSVLIDVYKDHKRTESEQAATDPPPGGA